MTRRRKLLTVGAILAVGLALAWPFRKTGSSTYAPNPAGPQAVETLRASNGDPIASTPSPTISSVAIAPEQIAAQTASTSSAGNATMLAGSSGTFDIANHPALADTVALPTGVPMSEQAVPAAQPAYDTALSSNTTVDKWPAELVHVVANGDTLEKLAERYLNDSGRALEIFDLNRDQLSNPHLLPIGVELRVPRNPDRIID